MPRDDLTDYGWPDVTSGLTKSLHPAFRRDIPAEIPTGHAQVQLHEHASTTGNGHVHIHSHIEKEGRRSRHYRPETRPAIFTHVRCTDDELIQADASGTRGEATRATDLNTKQHRQANETKEKMTSNKLTALNRQCYRCGATNHWEFTPNSTTGK